MATRCCVSVTDKNQTVNYYRHFDGYPTCTGIALFNFFLEYGSDAIRYDFQAISKKLTHDYEVTGEPDVHSDIEYWYKIEITRDKSIVCSVYERVEYEKTPPAQWKSHKIFEFGPHGLKFIEISN